MKFSCGTQAFLRSLNLVARAIGTQQALPILGNILIEAEGKRCTVSATDLELSIVTSFDAQIENEGSITVPAKAIINFAQYNADEEVLFETSEGTQLKCTSSSAKTVIAGEAASEYPTITPIEKETAFSIEALPLLEALQVVTFATAKTTLRPVLSGVYLRILKGDLVLVATDSYRLSEVKVSTGITDSDVSCIIPAKVLEELRSILTSVTSLEKEEGKDDKKQKKQPPTVDIRLGDQQVEITVGQTRFLSRLIEGKFPDYEQIIPKNEKTSFTVSAKDLTTTTKRMHYFAKEINNNLTFYAEGENLRITTPQTQAGKDEAELPINQTGDENKIALSSAYLLDFLSHTSSTEVEVHIIDSQHPAIFRIPGSPNYLHLIMPLRIQED